MSTSDTLRIRPMTRRDLSEVRAIEEAWLGSASFSSKLADWLGQPNRTGLVADEGGRIVGYEAYRFEVGDWRLVLEQLAVHPAWQRCRVGSKLLGRLFEACRNLEGSRVHVTAPECAVGLQLFLKTAGFRAVRILEAERAYLFEYSHADETGLGDSKVTRELGYD
jgi:predicted N-acetyltransferase YhbS